MRIFHLLFLFPLSKNEFLDTTLPELHPNQHSNITTNAVAVVEQHYSFLGDEVPSVLKEYDCTLQQGSLVFDFMDQIQSQVTTSKFFFSHKHNTLYQLTGFTLHAFTLENNTLNKVGELELEERQTSQCEYLFTMDDSQNSLYLFGCEKILTVTAKTVLVGVSSTIKKSRNTRPLKLLSVGVLFVQISAEGVTVYKILLDSTLEQRLYLTEFQSRKMEVVDVAVIENTLLLLDHNRGLLVYHYTTLLEFKEIKSINMFSEQQVYLSLVAKEHTVIVGIVVSQHVIAVEVEVEDSTFTLVRCFKGLDYIGHLLFLNQSLLIVARSSLLLFPVNRDPRTISSLWGLTSPHLEEQLQLLPLKGDLFIQISQKKHFLKRLKIIPNRIKCLFKNEEKINVTFRRSCTESYRFYQPCDYYQQFTLKVEAAHFDTLQWILMIAIGLLILLILGLAYWREKRVTAIDSIVKQIFRLKGASVQLVQEKQLPLYKQPKANRIPRKELYDEVSPSSQPPSR